MSPKNQIVIYTSLNYIKEVVKTEECLKFRGANAFTAKVQDVLFDIPSLIQEAEKDFGIWKNKKLSN